MNQSRRLRLGVGVIFTLAIVIAGLYLVTAKVAANELMSAVESQVKAIQTGDYHTAYALIAQTPRTTSTLEKFKTFVKAHPVLADNKEISFINEKQDNNTGIVKVFLTSKGGFVTPATFRLVKENGSWKISYITLSLDETVAESEHQRVEATPPAPEESTSVALTNVYQNERYSFSINYPNNWEYTLPNNKSILFSLKNTSGDLAPTIVIHPVLRQDQNGRYRSVKDLFSVVTKKLEAKGASVHLLERGRINLTPQHGERLDGRYVIIRYNYNGQEYKQMEVVYFMTEDRALYAIEYQAPAAAFDASLPVAKAMVQSFVFE